MHLDQFFNSVWMLQVRSKVRRHYAVTIVVLTIIALTMFPAYSVPIVLLATVVAIFLMFAAALNTRRANKLFESEPVQFVHVPTPIGSLLDSLKNSSIKLGDIVEMRLMSSDLAQSCMYLGEPMYGDEKGRSKLDYLLEVCPSLKLSVVGPAQDIENFEAIKSSAPTRVKLIAARSDLKARNLFEHKNLLVLRDGSKYVWYEPFHKVVDGRHYFGGGAYLYKISDKVHGKLTIELDSLAA